MTMTAERIVIDPQKIEKIRSGKSITVIEVPGASDHEVQAIFESYNKFLTKDAFFGVFEYGLTAQYGIRTRREFTLLPLILRTFMSAGYKVGVNTGSYRRDFIWHDEEPEKFWQTIALAQMWYEKPA